MGGVRKYLGAYLRGDPQNTNLPQSVTPNTYFVVLLHGAPSTAPVAMPGVQPGSSQLIGSASAGGAAPDPKTLDPQMSAQVRATAWIHRLRTRGARLGRSIEATATPSWVVMGRQPILSSRSGILMTSGWLMPHAPLGPAVLS
jgi:hypothetical protein